MKVTSVSIDSINLDPNNARRHSERNLDAIVASLKEYEQVKPIVVWRGTVLAGNGTLVAAKHLGWTKINVVTVPDDWSEEKARAYAIADNRTAELASWDEQVLLDSLRSLPEEMLEGTGFSEMDIRALEAIYGEIPEGHEGLVNPREPKVGKSITLHVDEDTAERWEAAWDALEGDDSARLNQIMDVLP